MYATNGEIHFDGLQWKRGRTKMNKNSLPIGEDFEIRNELNETRFLLSIFLILHIFSGNFCYYLIFLHIFSYLTF